MAHTDTMTGTEVSDIGCARVQVNICIELRAGLSKDDLSGLSILNDITLRTKDFVPKLREQFDTVIQSRTIALQSIPQC